MLGLLRVYVVRHARPYSVLTGRLQHMILDPQALPHQLTKGCSRQHDSLRYERSSGGDKRWPHLTLTCEQVVAQRY